VQIPKDKLDEKLAEGNSISKAPPLRANYAFQRDEKAEWMSYPYVIVQIMKTGKIPESQFANMEKLSSAGADLAKERYGALCSRLEFGKSYYDPSNRIMWAKGTFEIDPSVSKPDLGTICAFGAMHLTEKGAIRVFSYCRKAELEELQKVLEEILRSVRVGVNNRYTPEP